MSGRTDTAARCRHCKITLLDARKLGLVVPKQAGFMSIERGRRTLKEGCPRCLTSLERIDVEYQEVRVEYEQCPRCLLLVLDDGEIGGLRSIWAGARNVASVPDDAIRSASLTLGEELAAEIQALFSLLRSDKD